MTINELIQNLDYAEHTAAANALRDMQTLLGKLSAAPCDICTHNKEECINHHDGGCVDCKAECACAGCGVSEKFEWNYHVHGTVIEPIEVE